ncbi:MAG: coenzyme F420-0:L-glutamate ligase [Gammaproteobacteria bacterium]|nr:coenzyme F420-0:L-glutamate ligase [Gammaproteobacteria bacterium]MBQ0839919.1 coenzyme F420-0:L-glutamate ligase [Gammaproteobacteria bacterium]
MTATQLQLFALSDFPLVEPGDDLARLLDESLSVNQLALENGDVLVLAQKIVSKAENRYVDLKQVEPTAQALALAPAVDKDPRLVSVILDESTAVLRHCPGVLIVEHRLGYVMANAGIDASNIEHEDGSDEQVERVLLLPHNPDQFAADLARHLQQIHGVQVAVIINDSVGRAWRNGTTGLALGAAGLAALDDRRGDKDLYGRTLQVTEVAVADQLASAAALLQGEGGEGKPVVIIRGCKLDTAAERCNGVSALLRDKERDLFR